MLVLVLGRRQGGRRRSGLLERRICVGVDVGVERIDARRCQRLWSILMVRLGLCGAKDCSHHVNSQLRPSVTQAKTSSKTTYGFPRMKFSDSCALNSHSSSVVKMLRRLSSLTQLMSSVHPVPSMWMQFQSYSFSFPARPRPSVRITIPCHTFSARFSFRTPLPATIDPRKPYFFFDSSASALALALFSLTPTNLASLLALLNFTYAASSPFGMSPFLISLTP